MSDDAPHGAGHSLRPFATRQRTYRAVLTAPKVGPSLYEVCDPLLLRSTAGNAHLRQFYKTALANPVLRLVLRRAGLTQLRDAARLAALRDAIAAARDQDAPDWTAIGQPVAALLDAVGQQHPKPKRTEAPARTASVAEIDTIIRACASHLLVSYRRNGFIPCYAAFNLIGDPDLRGQRFPGGAARPQRARLQEFDVSFQPRPRLHRRLAGRSADQSALDRHCRADVGAGADPPSLGLLRCILCRSADGFPRHAALPRRTKTGSRTMRSSG